MCYGCVVSSLKFARVSCNSIYHIFAKDLLSFNSRFHRLHAERNWGLARYERTELRNDPCENWVGKRQAIGTQEGLWG